MATQVDNALREAKRLGWTAIAGGNHWKLIPPGGLCDETRQAAILPHTGSDRGKAFEKWLGDMRRYGQHGPVLVDAVVPRNGTPAKARANGKATRAQWHDPEPAPEPDPTKLSTDIETITPTIALKYLGDLYEGQRKVAEGRVDRYGADMESDDWTISTDAIGFDVDGKLINGQHRLRALVDANATGQFVVVRGLPKKAYDALDTGRNRSMADRLRSMGFTHPNELGGALTRLWHYAHNGDLTAKSTGGPSIPALLALLRRHPSLHDHAAEASRIGQRLNFSRSYLMALCYLFRAVDDEQATEFFRVMALAGAGEDQPAMLLHKAMVIRMSKARDRRPSDAVYCGMIVKAWNAHMRGETPSLLAWKRGTERFPAIWDPEERLAELLAGEPEA